MDGSLADYVSGAAALLSDTHLLCRMTRDTSFDALIPTFMGDLYNYIDLVASVHNVHFRVPRCQTYSRFRYTLRELAITTGQSELLCLDPYSGVEFKDIPAAMNSVSEEYQRLYTNRDVLVIINDTTSILHLPLQPDRRGLEASLDYYHMVTTIPSTGVRLCITYRLATVHFVRTEDDRLILLRERAAQSDILPARSLMMLGDSLMPLRIIPHATTRADVLSHCRSVDAQLRTPIW